MRHFLRSILFFVTIGVMTNCSEQEFSGIPTGSCEKINDELGEGACVQPTVCDGDECFSTLNYQVSACKADILFVVDNSGSMYSEQEELAQRFPEFINSIKDLDYQIAITTTDISTSPNNPPDAQNGNGTLWDGKLISFPNGSRFLKNSDSDKQVQFEETVQRDETLSCDGGGACPSGDERGIFAATLAVELAESRANKGSGKFFRDDSHLAIVVLSDENERSNGGKITGYPLEHRDLPETLVNTVGAQFGFSKLFSVHPIIVQSSITAVQNDTACNNTQNNQQNGSNFDRYGTLYEELASPNSTLKSMGGLVDGFAGSICESNYTNILQDIGQVITRNVGSVQLACSPTDLVVVIDGQESTDFTVDESNRLKLNVTPSCSQSVTVSYKCPANF